ncbi:MAG TPA: PIG-L family deacetylase [Acidimicrobiales bacterium]|nr:PIG-L family deacetylase [Acidimicrobiales bacterium]
MIHDPLSPGVVLSPHPDDAVLSAWSTLREPTEIEVFNVCARAPAPGTLSEWDKVFGVDDSATLVETRLAEDVAALAIAGRRATNLDFLDAQYRDEALAVNQVGAAVQSAAFQAAWLCAPAGIGCHPDHVSVREAALQIGRESGLPVFLYADFPYAVRWGWPHWVSGSAPRPHLVPEAGWAMDMAGASVDSDSLVPEVRVLTDEEVTGKVQALRCYRTQFAALNAGPLDRMLHPEIVRFELRWRVE